jgi:hypothetical protein
MTSARSLLRLAFAGLFVNAMAVACVVSDGDDDDDDVTACDAGSYKDCTCSNGEVGTKKCNASGSGYAACDCSDASNGGSGSGGEGNASSTAGTNSTPYGGENNGGAGGDKTAPVVGGAGGDTGTAGAGGEGPDPDALCNAPTDDLCQECVQVSCCEEWKACADETDGDCQQQYFNILACAQVDRAERDIKPADVEACAEIEVAGGSAWSDGLLPTTKALIDCTGGGVGWENRAWNQMSCNDLCFLQE